LEDDELSSFSQDIPAQIELIFKHYFDRVFRYVFSRTNNRQVAEDLTSQIFLKILEALPRYKGHQIQAAWVFTIAKNTIYSHYRFTLLHPIQSLEEAGFIEADPAGESGANSRDMDRYIDLEVNINHLPAKELELLRLRYAAGLSFSEVGAVVRKSPEAVKMAVHRILRKIEGGMEVMK